MLSQECERSREQLHHLQLALEQERAQRQESLEQVSQIQEAQHRIRELEALLVLQQTRSDELAHSFEKLAQTERHLDDVSQRLVHEQNYGAELLVRVQGLEQESAEATAGAEESQRVLGQIAMLTAGAKRGGYGEI